MTELRLVTRYLSRCNHPFVAVKGFETTLYCGTSYCKGECGYPALMLALPAGTELKAHSDMVAHGPVWQQKEWTGERVQVLSLFPDLDLNKTQNMWWY